MAEDEDYSKHPFAADAINRLAGVLAQRGQVETAVKYWHQVAVEFRTKSPEEARDAIWKVVEYNTKTRPDEDALRALYEEVRTFESRPQRIEGEVADSYDYWREVARAVDRFGQFDEDQKPQREAYYRYWAGRLDGRFPDDDWYQLQLAGYQREYERSFEAWAARLDEQFDRNMKPGDWNRVIVWANQAYYYIGMCHFAQGKWSKAIESLNLSARSSTPPAPASNISRRGGGSISRSRTPTSPCWAGSVAGRRCRSPAAWATR